jgi:hypothetical protein
MTTGSCVWNFHIKRDTALSLANTFLVVHGEGYAHSWAS